MYKMNMEHSMQFADHPLITVIAPIFQLSATLMKKSTRTSRISFVVRSRVSVWSLIIWFQQLLLFLLVYAKTSWSAIFTVKTGKAYKTFMQLKPLLLFDLKPFLVILLYLHFFFSFFNPFDLQSKNRTKILNTYFSFFIFQINTLKRTFSSTPI